MLSQETIADLKSHKRCIILFPHTTYWDAIVLLFYKLAYPELGQDLYTFMHEGFFNRAPKLFAWLGFISTTRAQQKDGGMIERTVAQFKNKESYKILLSPEGRLMASPWRSGYFYLAKGLQCSIRVVGADYETHELCFYPSYYLTENTTLEKIEPILKTDMLNIVPLYPDGSFITVRAHDPYLLYPYDTIMLTAWLGPMLMTLSALYLSMYFAAVVNLCSTLASAWYHYSREFNENARLCDIILCVGTYIMYGYLKCLRVGAYYTYFAPIPLVLHVMTIYYYYQGCGRDGHTARSKCYSRNHWKFHVAISILGLFTIWI